MGRTRHVDYLLIGGGIASLRAVEGIRSVDRSGKILLVGDEAWPPYDRPPLSKGIITGEVSAKETLAERRRFYWRHRVRVRRGTRVTELDLSQNTPVATLAEGTKVTFGRALYATGGRARWLDFADEAQSGVRVLRTLDDAIGVRADVVRGGGRVAIVGAGFIGAELAASLVQVGLTVDLIEARGEVWAETAPRRLREYVRAWLENRGVGVYTGSKVRRLDPSARITRGAVPVTGGTAAHSLLLSTGARVEADLVCIAAGIVPNTEIAERAGIAVDDGIVCDKTLRSSDERVYAAGDVARIPDSVSGRSRRVEHYDSAEYSGLLAGENMARDRTASVKDMVIRSEYDFLATLWSDIGSLHVESAGDDANADWSIERGTLEPSGNPGPWLTFGISDDRIVAYYALNAARADISAAQLLVRNRVHVSTVPDALRDTAVPLSATAGELLKNR
ncbi:MAG: NAD(P)/FAD-dependent oxidoreductase [Spirochaetales bacterium]